MNNVEKRKVSLCWLAILVLIFGPNVLAQKANRAFSLQEAKQFAIENNQTMRNAKLDVRIANKKVWETTAIGLPQVTAKADYQHIFNVPTLPPQFGGAKVSPADNTTFSLQVSQLIFSGEYIVGLQAAKVYKMISEQSLVKSKIEIGALVESTYYMALVIDENLKIVQQNKSLTAQTLTEMEAMLKAGFIEDTNVDQLRVNLNLLNNLELSLQGQSKNINNQLKYQLGMELTDDLVLTDKLDAIITNVSPFEGHDFALLQNIDYKIVTNSVASQKLLYKRELTTFLPTVAGFYQHKEWQKVPAFNFEPKDVLGISFSLPIFTSGSRWVKVKQAKLSLEKAQNSQTQLEKGLALQYENQQLNYQTAYNSYLNQRESSEISKKIFDKTTIKFKEGVSSSLELTQVQSQYLTSVSNYYSAVLSLLNARVELQKLTAQ